MADDVAPHLRAGLRISQVSLGWTGIAGSTAVVIGVVGNSLALVTFGLIGLVDGIGSASLIVHFRHSQHENAVSARHERRSLVIVTAGMAIIGVATVIESVYRLQVHAASHSLLLGIFLAMASAFLLTALAVRKQRIASLIPSHALHSDGWVSMLGAVLALIVLLGTALEEWFGLWWIDPVAAILIASGGVGLSAVLLRGPRDDVD